jgi:hypothetical protein
VAAGAALAQSQTGSTAAPPPAASTPPATSTAHPTLSSVLSQPPPVKPLDPNTNQPTYSVNPPPDGPSGVYLPAAVLGYAKSAAGCVVVGCDAGPDTGGAPPASSSAPATPASAAPPANPGPAATH